MGKSFNSFYALLLCVVFQSNILAYNSHYQIPQIEIFTRSSCKIQLISELVEIDLFNDSASVNCIFELYNSGDSITIEIGFPEMNFQYRALEDYSDEGHRKFQISVNDKILTSEQIKVPNEFENIYNTYMAYYQLEREYSRKKDSLLQANNVIVRDKWKYVYKSRASRRAFGSAFDALYERRSKQQPDWLKILSLEDEFNEQMSRGNFPGYVWRDSFKSKEKKTIKVSYSLPSGEFYGMLYRYFTYLLSTSDDWYGSIVTTDIKVNLYDIQISNIEKITPSNYKIDSLKKEISWKFENYEPNKDNDIYIQYFNPLERKAFEVLKKSGKKGDRPVHKLWFLNR